MTIETRAVAWTVAPIGEPAYSEMSTQINITDESGGEFVEVNQTGRTDLGTIQINPDEWPDLRAAIDHAISQCRSNGDMDELRAKAKGSKP
jgi:DNA-binding protein YbaB